MFTEKTIKLINSVLESIPKKETFFLERRKDHWICQIGTEIKKDYGSIYVNTGYGDTVDEAIENAISSAIRRKLS